MIRGLPTRVRPLVWLLAAGGLSAAALLCRHTAGERGLRLTIRPVRAAADAAPTMTMRVVSGIDVRDLWPQARSGAVFAQWDGFWRVPAGAPFELEVRSDGAVSLFVDGREELARRAGARSRGVSARVDLPPGFHDLSVRYEAAAPGDLRVLWSPAGEGPRELDPGSLFVRVPSAGQQARSHAAPILVALALAAWLVPPLVLWSVRPPAADTRARLRRIARVALPALVVLYAAALRFEALVARYSWQGPRGALEAERVIGALHPDSLRWQPAFEGYSGDPYNYLVRAREMEGFYEPNVREPLFPLATRLLLKLLGDRNVAVNAASAVFSTLAVLATYLLGAAFSPAVGLGAALGMAVHRDAIWWGVEGFRDDALTFFAVLSALALLRLRVQPTRGRAVMAGLAGAGALLSRVTSLSFLVPAAVAALGRGPEAARRRKALALAAAVVLLVAGPYLLSCALAYGDPLYAVNFHTKFYRSRSGMAFDTSMGWSQYLRAGFRPFQLVDTGLTGLTTYPFGNKWMGFDYLSPWVGRVLAPAAVIGLLLLAGSPGGRLVLVVLLTSLLPYSFTWPVPGGAEWRFTMHALPFLLIAAFLALERGARLLLRPSVRRQLQDRLRERRRALAVGTASAAAAGLCVWGGLCALSYLRVRESLRAGEAALISAGPRDLLFFDGGWSRPRRRGVVTVRRAERSPAVVWLPLGDARDQRLTLRVDPDPPRPEMPLSVAVNGVTAGTVAVRWDEQRIGGYDVVLPARVLRPGRNRLELGPGGFVLWYVRVEPAASAP